MEENISIAAAAAVHFVLLPEPRLERAIDAWPVSWPCQSELGDDRRLFWQLVSTRLQSLHLIQLDSTSFGHFKASHLKAFVFQP